MQAMTEYYRHKQMGDGHLNICKGCVRLRITKRYNRLIKDPVFLNAERERTRERNHPLGKLEEAKLDRSKQKRKLAQKVKDAYAKRNPAATKARHMVNNAVRDGRLERKGCEVCGSLEVEGHHDDYSKPLDVRWLCDKHHKELHVQLRKMELLG